MPLLCIGISMHARAGDMAETLDSMIPQLDDDVELSRVDGSSTDNTQDALREFSEREKRLYAPD